MYKRNNFIYFKIFQFIIFSLSSFFFFYNLLEWMDNSTKQNKIRPKKKLKHKKTFFLREFQFMTYILNNNYLLLIKISINFWQRQKLNHNFLYNFKKIY